MADELLNTDNLQAVLMEYGVAVRNLYQDRLILHDRIATGDLLNSVEVHVDYNGEAYEVKLDLVKGVTPKGAVPSRIQTNERKEKPPVLPQRGYRRIKYVIHLQLASTF